MTLKLNKFYNSNFLDFSKCSQQIWTKNNFIGLKVTNTSKDVHVYDDVELLIQWFHWPCLYKVKENSKWKPKVHLTQYLLRKQPRCCTQNIGLFINCIHCRLSCCSSPWETFTLIDLLSPLLDLSFALVKKKSKIGNLWKI